MSSYLGLNVVGFLGSVIGQGRSAQRFGDGLDAAGVPWAGFDLPLGVPRDGPPVPRFGTAPFPYRATVLWCNPFRYGLDLDVDVPLTRGRFTAGRWAWELERLPPSWAAGAQLLDEVWVISSFVAHAVRAAVDVPVVVLPLPIAVRPAPPPLERARFGLPADAFVFGFTFDHHSTTQRKNPGGVIEAYRRAFAEDDATALLVKSVNARSNPAAADELRAAAAGRADIRVVDEALTAAEMDALLAGLDCYVSLHRAEGFGLGMAEAMAHGTPVIATGYSGNLEFMTADTALLVAHRRVPVGLGAGPYPPDGVWAEPDLDHAAALMRRLAGDPSAAAELGARGRAAIARRFAPEVAGAVAAEHIASIHRTLAVRDVQQQPSVGSSRSSSGPRSSSSSSV